MTKVLSVGGSIIVPEKPDTEFLSKFISMVTAWLDQDKSRRLILVAGGGAPARVYQNAYRKWLKKQGLVLRMMLQTGLELWPQESMLSF